jgi:hypothetical protein
VYDTKIDRQIENHKYEVPVYKKYRRDPDGVWENIRSFFGKKYYTATRELEKRIQTVDLGFDVGAAVKDLSTEVQKVTMHCVYSELQHIKSDILEKFIQHIEKIKIEIEEVRDTLLQRKAEMKRHANNHKDLRRL